jgi:hypothetical protein
VPNRPEYTRFRQYPCGEVYHQDDFEEKDNSFPFVDDYLEIEVPDWLINYFEEIYVTGDFV